MSDKPENVTWQVWVIVTVVVAFIGALPTLYAEFNKRQESNQPQKTNQPSSSVPTPTISSDLLGKHQGVIESTIRASRVALSDAYTTGRTNVLSQYFSGYVLTGYIDLIKELHESGQYAIYDVQDLTIDSMRVDPDELEAIVKASTRERFIYYFFNDRQKCSEYTEFSNYSFTFTLNRTRNGWIINKQEFTNSPVNRMKC